MRTGAGGGAQWMYPWHYDMEQASSWETEEDDTIDPEEDDEDFVEILPDVIKGWLLLEKANVDHMERSLIQSEVRSNFSLQAVETAMRSHFTDDMIRKKDGEAKHALFGEDEVEEDEGVFFEEEDGQVLFEDLSPEDRDYYQQARSEAEAA